MNSEEKEKIKKVLREKNKKRLEEKLKDKYLPIGTIVKLIGSPMPVMITGFCIKPEGKITGPKGEIENKEDTYFDYCACPYPIGTIKTDLNIVLNHENIEAIIYLGLDSKLHQEYSKFLKGEVELIDKKQKENK